MTVARAVAEVISADRARVARQFRDDLTNHPFVTLVVRDGQLVVYAKGLDPEDEARLQELLVSSIEMKENDGPRVHDEG